MLGDPGIVVLERNIKLIGLLFVIDIMIVILLFGGEARILSGEHIFCEYFVYTNFLSVIQVCL